MEMNLYETQYKASAERMWLRI